MDNSKILGMNENLEYTLEEIFAAIIVGEIDLENKELVQKKREVFRQALPLFESKFSDDIFFNEYAIVYEILRKVRVKTFSKKQLDTIISNNTDLILDSPYIDMSKYTMSVDGNILSDEEKVEAFKYYLYEMMDKLSNRYVTIEQFNSACEIYVNAYKNFFMTTVAQNMSMIMSETGFDDRLPGRRKRHLKGADDAQQYYADQIQILKALDEENRIRSYVVDEEWLEKSLEEENKEDTDVIIDFGIDEIDRYVGKLHRGNMLEFMGPPKGGKTTFTTYMVERCLEAGLNVAVWPLEGETGEWEALIEALMVRKFKENPLSLNKKDILDRNYSDDAMRQSVISAKVALATDPTRGKLSFLTGTAYLEDFRDELDNHYKNKNAFDVIVIDSPINFMSHKIKNKPQCISEAYMSLKDYVANKMTRKALCIVTAQLKQDVVDFLRKNPGETIDVTAGGESAETIRTPDEIIGLFSSKNERSLGQMKIYNVASRHHETFEDFYIGCELGCGYFFSKSELNE